MRSIQVSLAERSYPILVGAGLLGNCDPLRALAAGRQVAIVTDVVVGPLYAQALRGGLGTDPAKQITVTLPSGETNKTWDSLNRIFDALLEARFDRACLIVALGGGVVGDMAGFAAAVYQRGVDFVQIPTTLLAQVDSSVGGKTAINHPAGKNMIGSFHQPRLVVADLDTLRSLPPRELSAGLAEVIKHGAIADAVYLAAIDRDMPALRACEQSVMAEAVVRSCEIKADVVARDEREGGVRAILNFGHTFGHAIEAGLGFGEWLHGEAVGAGMVQAADLSCRLGSLLRADAQALTGVIERAGLPIGAPVWSYERWLDLMSVDKKAEQGAPRFVVLDGIGHASLRRVPDVLLRETLAGGRS